MPGRAADLSDRRGPVTRVGRVLTVIVCGVGPACEVGTLITLARERGWTVQVVATPTALEFLDVAAIEDQTGSRVHSQCREPGEPRSRPAQAIIVAPATYNTINKWARGTFTSDNYALGILAETTSMHVPTVVLPFVDSDQAGHGQFKRSVNDLRREGIRVLLGAGGVEPHSPATGSELIEDYPWQLALNEAERLVESAQQPVKQKARRLPREWSFWGLACSGVMFFLGVLFVCLAGPNQNGGFAIASVSALVLSPIVGIAAALVKWR